MNVCPPIDFIDAEASITWRDLVWAQERGLVSENDLREVVASEGAGRITPGITLQVAKNLALDEPFVDDDVILEKWLYLCLLWAYRNRDVVDIFSRVEEIYSMFDYPMAIESFVRYLPATGYDPSKHSLRENQERLMSRLQAYLHDSSERFSLKSDARV